MTRQKADIRPAGAQKKTDRIIRIVRDGKSIDRQVAHFEGGAGAENAAVEPGLELILDGFLGQTIAVDGNRQFGAQSGQALDVVAVLVRDQDSVQAFGSAADGSQPLANLTAAKTRIDKHARLLRLEIGAVARRTAAENGEMDCHAPTLELRNGRGNPFALRKTAGRGVEASRRRATNRG